ncbi:MAG: metal ABC transporter permease [Phycisphaerales bacterium]|nr:metal ABC transporter permease [Phycisphaerales bacterium]
MTTLAQQFWTMDVPAGLTAVFAALACGVLGSFLVLRKQALMGDAISHAVLPGIVIAFLLTGSRATLPVLVGAAVAGVLTVVLVEALCRLARVEAQASMGVVFSLLFALGVILVRRTADRVDLDPDCVLYGQLETIFWERLTGPVALLDPTVWADAPHQLASTGAIALLSVAAVTILFKELRIAAFDPGLATAQGFRAGVLHYVLMVLVACAVVASFEAVGSILVVAMLVCPAASARLLTDRLSSHVWLSALISAASAAAGYVIAGFGPAAVARLTGWDIAGEALSASGMIAATSGLVLAAAIFLAPSHGVVARAIRRRRLRARIDREDLLASLFRDEEQHRPSDAAVFRAATVRAARRLGQVDFEPGGTRIRLTESGRTEARRLIRAHRLWEGYLVDELGARPDQVHRTATELEHVTDAAMDRELAPPGAERRDQSGKPVPPRDS